jgi:hypothetical protein
MRNYLRKNGYDIFYFDFPDEQKNLLEENPFARTVSDLVDRALEDTGFEILSLQYENGNSPAGPVLLNFESPNGPSIPQLDTSLDLEMATRDKVLAMSIRDYVMQQKQR